MIKLSALAIEIPANIGVGKTHPAVSGKRLFTSGFMLVQVNMPSDFRTFRIKRVLGIPFI